MLERGREAAMRWWLGIGCLTLVLCGPACPTTDDDSSDDDDAGGAFITGLVALTAYEQEETGCLGAVTGGFWIGYDSVSFEHGPCVVVEGSWEPPTYLHAGTVVLSGVDGGDISMEIDGLGLYYPVPVPCSAWGPDSTLECRSLGGGEVGTFN
jgi:hypothetical protein